MENNTKSTCQIHTLEEIVMRKDMVRENLHNDDKKIKELWGSLFETPNLKSPTPAKRLTGLMNLGAGFIDGAILAWKLYHKFKKK